MKNSVYITYEDVFEDLDIPKDELLNGFGRNLLMLHGTALINMSKPGSKFLEWEKCLNEWFGPSNKNARDEIYNKIKSKEDKFENVTLLNMISSLKLIDFTISRGFTEVEINEGSSSIELPLLQFYLHLNKENIKDGVVSKSIEEEEKVDDKFCAFFISQLFAHNDIINYDIYEIIITQFVKSTYLLDFISTNPNFKKVYDAFLSLYEVNTWQDYLMSFAPMAFAITPRGGYNSYIDHIVEKNDKYKINCTFFDRHILNIDTEIPNSDFRYLRSKPFYKIEEGRYRAIYDLFIAEKIYNGLPFVFSNINSNFVKADRIDIKGELGGNFSENYLFYGIIERITQGRYKTFRGQKIKELYKNTFPSEPDYYLRNGKNVLVFESKDVLVKADVKISFDFKQIREELAKKFYADGKSDKAVLQLIRNIKRTLALELPFDRDYKPMNINIYPIIITHHRMYDTPGINHLINKWFNEELEKVSKAGIKITNVRPITIINIDTLIFYEDLFTTKKLLLWDLIDKYCQSQILNTKKRYKNQEEVEQTALLKFSPFSEFVHGYTRKNKLEAKHSFFIEKGLELINNQHNKEENREQEYERQ